MGYPRGLIRYSTEHAIEQHWQWKDIIAHIVRPRILIYSSVLFLLVGAFLWGLAHKNPLRVDVIRDRAILAREVGDDLVENVYRLQVMNISETTHRYSVEVEGLKGIGIDGEQILEVPAATTSQFTLRVRAPEHAGHEGSNRIYFNLQSMADPKVHVHEKATFLQP